MHQCFQLLECTQVLDVVYRILGLDCLWWSTGDEVDHTIDNTPPIDKNRYIEVGEL